MPFSDPGGTFPLTREQFGQYLTENFTLIEGDADFEETFKKLWMILIASPILSDRP